MSFFRLNGRSRNKYKNQKVCIDGIKFDSKKEAERYRELKIREFAGAIKNLRLQVPYQLIPPQEGGIRACHYIADFVYCENGKEIVEDTKGYKSEAYKLKKKLMKWIHNIDIRET